MSQENKVELTKGQKVAKRTLRRAHTSLDDIFIVVLILLLIFAGYARWDSQQLYTTADPIQYLQYKPSPPYMMSFEDLQKKNPDVIGWLTVYDTNIDYPLVQSKKSNSEYLNKNPLGEYEMSGSLFLDIANDPEFKDFNTLIYGHHMGQHKMFGDLDLFLDKDFFNSHEYGNLIFNAQNHGLQFVAMLKVDAYDQQIYSPGLKSEEARLNYINHIYDEAIYIRGVDVKKQKKAPVNQRQQPITPDDHLVLLSTCSEDITNGRYILVAKMLDHPVENPFPETEHKVSGGIDSAKLTYMIGKLSIWQWLAILIGAILLMLLLYRLSRRRDQQKYEKKLGEKAHENPAS